MANFMDLAESVLTRGIDAYAETQQVRYQANNPVPNNRGASDITAPEGQPARETIQATFSNPTNLALLAVAGVLLVVLLRR